jgi:putative sterol carrier protein
VQEVGSEDWVQAFADAVEGVEVDPAARAVVQQEVVDAGTSWHVVLGGGRARVVAGPHDHPDVTFSQEAATAAAIAAGELSAQQAFVDGRLRVRGAVGALVGPVAAALAALPAVPATGGR